MHLCSPLGLCSVPSPSVSISICIEHVNEVIRAPSISINTAYDKHMHHHSHMVAAGSIQQWVRYYTCIITIMVWSRLDSSFNRRELLSRNVGLWAQCNTPTIGKGKVTLSLTQASQRHLLALEMLLCCFWSPCYSMYEPQQSVQFQHHLPIHVKGVLTNAMENTF